MIDPILRDKVVLITGANHGIGAATASAFGAQDAPVFLTYLRIPSDASDRPVKPVAPGEALYHANRARSADAVVQAVRGIGGRAEAWEADLADPSTVSQLFDRAEATFGPVQVLVNNAAHWESDSFLPAGREPWNRLIELWTAPSQPVGPESHDRHFAVNSRATVLMIAEFARRHIARGARWGRIINGGE